MAEVTTDALIPELERVIGAQQVEIIALKLALQAAEKGAAEAKEALELSLHLREEAERERQKVGDTRGGPDDTGGGPDVQIEEIEEVGQPVSPWGEPWSPKLGGGS